MTLTLAVAAVVLVAAWRLSIVPPFAHASPVPGYGPWPNPNHSRSTPMPTTTDGVTTTLIGAPLRQELELGDITATAENPTLGNGTDPAIDVLVNHSLAAEPHGDHCIRVGSLTLTADQAIRLCAVLEPVARQVATTRQLIGDQP